MPACHQCNQDIGAHSRTGDCSICFASDVTFCATCAMWELGPQATDDDIFDDLRTAPVSVEIDVQRQHSEESDDSTSTVAELPLDCKAFLATLAEVCPYIKGQLRNHDAKLYGKRFKTYACEVLDKFRALYPTCKYDRLALQVLLIMHLSSQERVQCRDSADKKAESSHADVKYLKRWQTRTIAATHLAQHLDAIEDEFGSDIKDLVGNKTWRDALALDDFELFMKGFKSPTLMAIDLLALAGGADAARETLEIAIIVYHALTATRRKSKLAEHWSQKATNFLPGEALGFLSTRHYEALYGDGDGSEFCDEAKAKLNALWKVLGDGSPANQLPAHPRFADTKVANIGGLTAVEKNYLQYLPVFDHRAARAHRRSECERVVRARVVASVGDYRRQYCTDVHLRRVTVRLLETTIGGKLGSPKYIRVSVPEHDEIALKFDKLPNQPHVRTDLAPGEQDKLDDLLGAIRDPAYLAARGNSFDLEVTYEIGNTRRTTRRDAVLGIIRAALETDGVSTWLQYSSDPDNLGHDGVVVGDDEAYTDRLIKYMRRHFHVDQCFDDDLARLLMTRNDVLPKAWFPLKLRAKPYADIFPACGFAVHGPELDVIDEHYAEFGGTSPRPAHYVDWRNHKDLWLYDCFAILPRRRPLFCSLSLQPIVPEPNPNYGSHTLLFSRSRTENRSVHTFGDKQQPRRSMLLLLDDILYERAKKDGQPGQSADNRAKVADDLLRRFERVKATRNLSLELQWAVTLAEPAVPYPGPDLLLECQIFGPINPTHDLRGLVTWVESGVWMGDYVPAGNKYFVDSDVAQNVTDAQNHVNTTYAATLLGYAPSQHHTGYAPMTRRNIAEVPNRPARAAILDKQASDHADAPGMDD
jgi:hypothetical protein